MMRFATTICAALVSLLGIMGLENEAKAEEIKHGNTEFALLQSINFIIPEHGEKATAFTLPSVTPGIRITYWTKHSLTFDFGLSFGHATQGFDDFTLMQIEGGIGIEFPHKSFSTRPYAGVLVGMLSVSGSQMESESELYVGVQAGIRKFIRDYAATRLQIGYRKTMGDYFELGNVEIAGGLSFFL